MGRAEIGRRTGKAVQGARLFVFAAVILLMVLLPGVARAEACKLPAELL